MSDLVKNHLTAFFTSVGVTTVRPCCRESILRSPRQTCTRKISSNWNSKQNKRYVTDSGYMCNDLIIGVMEARDMCTDSPNHWCATVESSWVHMHWPANQWCGTGRLGTCVLILLSHWCGTRKLGTYALTFLVIIVVWGDWVHVYWPFVWYRAAGYICTELFNHLCSTGLCIDLPNHWSETAEGGACVIWQLHIDGIQMVGMFYLWIQRPLILNVGSWSNTCMLVDHYKPPFSHGLVCCVK